jgi:hypothetical protein
MSLARYNNIRLEGGLFVPDLLERAAQGRCDYQSPADYHIPKGIQLHDEYGRAFKIAQAQWKEFSAYFGRSDIGHDDLVRRTRSFVLEFLRDVLAYDDLIQCPGIEIDAHHYPVTFLGAVTKVPVIVAPASLELTQPDESFVVGGGGARRKSAVQLMQEYLNATKDHTWGLVTNGRRLRLLRDSATLTRPCYLEIDLETILQDDVYHEFKAAWLLLHASRAKPVKNDDNVWEGWRKNGQTEGMRVREGLRKGVTGALIALGEGFLQHKANEGLCRALNDGSLKREAYFEQLLRLVYRFIFLFTTEERGILHPDDDSPEANAARDLYAEGYALSRLSQRALRRQGYDEYHDLWQGIQILMRSVRAGEPRLALPALGGLFAETQCPDIDRCLLTNRVVLTVMRHLRWAEIEGSLTRVDYRNMGPEELGSVYESLLELVPNVDVTMRMFKFIGFEDEDSTTGNKRKTTGSYYTPDSLVKELIKSALDPVIEARLAEQANTPEKALLNIAVIDPACGSGHFLLSAARRLAERLAPLRAQDGVLHDDDYRAALRDVISHCIYGVDRNPLALELARTALWLEGFEPGRPLTFLDHHLVCGDALLGVQDFEQLRNGIPKDAYKMLSGDDRKVCTELTRINSVQLKALNLALQGQKELVEQEEREDIFLKMTQLEAMPGNTTDDIVRKEQAYKEFLSAARDSHPAHAADLFVGAFLVPKDSKDAVSRVPTTEALQHELTGSGIAATPEMRHAVEEACQQARVLHWPLAFPHIFARGGFDCVLANPPWERIKLQEQEFFATRVPAVAVAKHKAERSKRIAWLSEGILASNLNPDVFGGVTVSEAEKREYREFIIARRVAEAMSEFAHVSGADGGRFPLTGTGDVNTYALFSETISSLIDDKGRAGFIVPTGIATDDSTKFFFTELTSTGRLVSLFSFENEEFIFPDVHHSFRFCLFTIAGKGACEKADFVFFARKVEDLFHPSRRFTLSQDDFFRINPNTRTCPIFRSQKDAELTRKIYQNVPVLVREGVDEQPDDNSWGIRLSTMFHMSNDSHLFVDTETVLAGDSKRQSMLPLYEAKMIHQFDHRWATYRLEDGKDETHDVSLSDKQDPEYAVRPRYYVEERQVLARIANVPSAFAKAYADKDMAGLLVALANWIHVSDAREDDGAAISCDSQPNLMPVANEQLGLFGTKCEPLNKRYPILTENDAGIALPKEWIDPKVITSSTACLLTVAELKQIQQEFNLEQVFDRLMSNRSPKWLFGYRDITSAHVLRTVIASVVPQVGVGHTLPLMTVSGSAQEQAMLLGNLDSLALDFVARQKVGGTHLTYSYLRQFPVLSPDRYSDEDLAFITPRVLELTYTSRALDAWAEALGYTGDPFVFDPDRREQLRAQLDAYYARLYGLTRDDLRYILDPEDIMGPDCPSETFRVLKNTELKTFGEYRTQRLVLEAWDHQEKSIN